MTSLTQLVTWYSAHFADNVIEYADFAPMYGWLAAASAIVALLTVMFTFFRREAGRAAALAVGQHFLVWGFPLFLPAIMQFFTEWGAK